MSLIWKPSCIAVEKQVWQLRYAHIWGVIIISWLYIDGSCPVNQQQDQNQKSPYPHLCMPPVPYHRLANMDSTFLSAVTALSSRIFLSLARSLVTWSGAFTIFSNTRT